MRDFVLGVIFTIAVSSVGVLTYLLLRFAHVVSTSAAIAESRHVIDGSSDLLDRETRHTKDRNVG